MDILQYIGTMARILVPLAYSRRFIEHFPFGPGDEVQQSSKEIGFDYQFVIYIHHHVPRDEQLRYILQFSHEIEHKQRGILQSMFKTPEEQQKPDTVRFLFSMTDREEKTQEKEVEPPYSNGWRNIYGAR